MTEQNNSPVDAEKGRPTISRLGPPPSKLNAFIINTTGALENCDVEDAVSKRDKGSYWIDASVYSGRDALELQNLLDDLNLSPFLRQHLAQPKQLQTSQVLTLSSAALIVLRVLSLEDDSKEIQYVVALCREDLLLTITVCQECAEMVAAGKIMSQRALKYMQAMELPQPSTSGALATWMMFHLERVSRALGKLRSHIFDLDEMQEKTVKSVSLADISGVKDELLRLTAVAEEQSECVQSVAERESITSSIDFSQLRGTLGFIRHTAEYAERMAIRLEKRVSHLREAYDAHQQEKMNRRLSVLTIFSAIFLPISLMAGIWGMNFANMPGLDAENGYYFALGSMLLVAVVMILSFYYFGWFS